ncbi:DoxX family protein [Novosphingobium mathurense]|uniref:Putative oxidoreductase n=1 Tax=Novosphingobium mathurense TaxID=428990 RepID=A0A1U6ILS4_9SPHN|nr:DoxX family protein [Novosphingobium mathurense]SLK08961.1 putative oxidoreductase [Novosphingobium mathurense]
MREDRFVRYAPQILGILRIMTALLYMQHGLQKLFKFPDAGHHPEPFQILTLAGIAGILETFGGLSVLLGLFMRPVAFVLCGQMAVAYFLVHLGNNLGRPNGIFPVVNGGDLAILFCFVFLYLFIAGPGAFSIDGRLSAKKGEKS